MNHSRKILSLVGFLVLFAGGVRMAALTPQEIVDKCSGNNRPLRTPVQLTLTVGPESGDLRGSDDKVVQAGIDYLDRLGGGVLKLLPGTYTFRNAVYLRPNITLRGSGALTLITRGPSVTTPLVRNADWFEYGFQVKDPTGFVPGGGIMLHTKDEQGVDKYYFATVTAVQGDFIFMDRRTETDFWLTGEASASTLFSLLTGRDVDDVKIEDLTLDGNRANCANVNDNFGAAVYLKYCNRWTFTRVESRNYNGDGFSFQVCDDIHFEGCRAIGNADLGFHPGSGSQRPVFHNCISTGNSQGIFFCWGVSDGLAENCVLSNNTRYGINFGHRDTENTIRNCVIEGNNEVGIIFRKERVPFESGDRNLVENCTIRDNGPAGKGVGVDITWVTKDVTIRNCKFENTSGRQATAIRIGPEVGAVILKDNSFPAGSVEVEDQRPKR